MGIISSVRPVCFGQITVNSADLTRKGRKGLLNLTLSGEEDAVLKPIENMPDTFAIEHDPGTGTIKVYWYTDGLKAETLLKQDFSCVAPLIRKISIQDNPKSAFITEKMVADVVGHTFRKGGLIPNLKTQAKINNTVVPLVQQLADYKNISFKPGSGCAEFLENFRYATEVIQGLKTLITPDSPTLSSLPESTTQQAG